ncbi:RHS repeat-associated core domain-containing protein [Lysinibacillus sp. M3]|uniref:RHS repeat-associated core domain-containing protein n=1 Tax=Lysinibacillus zambalensis TaxID=3160866 RepID=A0ABV1N0R5_9BACI
MQNTSDKFENPVEYSSENKSEIPDNLVTWVFNGGFVPSAKITSEGNYSIISDYLGTPVEAYDEEGNKVWSAELDIFGRVKEFTDVEDFIPFRYQGQYEDVETGLYYNRFRYYSPVEGIYTQVDPIGLTGGNPTLYAYVIDPNIWIDPFGLNVSTGAGRTHITYEGIRNGKQYTGYASMPGTGRTPSEVLNYRYPGGFDPANPKVPDVRPDIMYHVEGVDGKNTARGLEQHGFEENVKNYGRDQVDNKQNPVGKNNKKRDKYKKAAKAELEKRAGIPTCKKR